MKNGELVSVLLMLSMLAGMAVTLVGCNLHRNRHSYGGSIQGLLLEGLGFAILAASAYGIGSFVNQP